jgi:hypothetical protein
MDQHYRPPDHCRHVAAYYLTHVLYWRTTRYKHYWHAARVNYIFYFNKAA